MLTTRNRHPFHQQRAALFGTAYQHIISHRRNAAQHGFQVASDGDFFDCMADFAIFHPLARYAARVVSGNGIDTMPEQLGHQ